MSYSLSTPCWNCKKEQNCTDQKDIQEGINNIHLKDFDHGHKGSGQIILLCTRMIAKNE